MIDIRRVQGLNMPGLCYFDVVAVTDVAVMPPVVDGVINDPILLIAGANWHRFELAKPGSKLVEKWSVLKGLAAADFSLTGFAGKDEVAKLQALWNLSTTRFIVRAEGLNGDVLLAGTVEEGCRAAVSSRVRGDESSVKNGYDIEFSVKRAEPVPFYLPALPPSVPPNCPSLSDLLQTTTVSAVVNSMPPLLYTQFLVYFNGLGCATLAQLVAAASNADLYATLSNAQAIYIAQQVINIVDGGDSNTWPGDAIDGGGPPPDDGEEFDINDFESADFITT